MRLSLLPGERRGYWKYFPRKNHRQTIVQAHIEDRNAKILLDSGADVSILDSAFAREAGIQVDTSERLNCVGVGGGGFVTDGKAKVKITLARELVYEFELWVGKLDGTQAILGTDFMAPAGVRLDLAEGAACMPDEIRLRFEGRRPVYSDKVEQERLIADTLLMPGQSVTVKCRAVGRLGKKLWVARGDNWVTTAVMGRGNVPSACKVTNISSHPTAITPQTIVGLWLSPLAAPQRARFVSVGSKRYTEWESLVYEVEPEPELEARRQAEADAYLASQPPAVSRPMYEPPKAILRRNTSRSNCHGSVPSQAEDDPSRHQADPCRPVAPRADPEPAASPTRAKVAILQAATVAEVVVDQRELAEPVYIHEGGDLSAEDVERQMAMLPEATPDDRPTIDDVQVGCNEGHLTPDQVMRVKDIVWKRSHLCMGKGNAKPAAAKDVWCDIDVGNALPVAQRCRKVPPKFLGKLFDLVKGLLSAGFVEVSTSPWASPIVIVVKKNGVDIRLCIDYRVVNSLTRLMVYPMPAVTELLDGLDSYLWFCSLDMASGFWVVKMTERASAISAFVTPFGLFEWTRMPFGLKNAPQIYQRMLDNALYGILRIPEAAQGGQASERADRGVFTSGEADPDGQIAIGRRSYIDDILIGDATFDGMCEKLERLMQACERWSLSISLPKSQFAMRKVEYLGHRVSSEGVEAKPKNGDELSSLTFPKTVKGIQSFLGSLNYYHRFIPDFAVHAAALYEVTQQDLDRVEVDPNRLRAARQGFETLKSRLTHAPVLRHFDEDKPVVVVVFANDWAIAAAVAQVDDGVLKPTRYVGRVLKDNERKFSPAEREVLALMRVLDVCYPLLAGKPIRVLTRSTTMGWLLKAKGLQGRLGVWNALLSPWDLCVEVASKGEHQAVGLIAAALSPEENADEALDAVRPHKAAIRTRFQAPVPTLKEGEQAWVVSFDGSAKPRRQGGSCGAVLWKTADWSVADARSWVFPDATVNEAEYRGAIEAMRLAETHGVRELIICGDSRIVIQQLRGEISCRTPGLQVFHAEASAYLLKFERVWLVHVKRAFNAAADYITSRALQRGDGEEVGADGHAALRLLNKLPEVFAGPALGDTQAIEAGTKPIAPVVAVATRSGGGNSRNVVRSDQPQSTDAGDDRDRQRGVASDDESWPSPETVQRWRSERIHQAQDEERWIANLKRFLAGHVTQLDTKEAADCAKLAATYEVVDDLLYFVGSRTDRGEDGRLAYLRLVVPTTLQEEVLHHYHTSLAGGHQGVARTYEKVRRYFHWRGLYRAVKAYVRGCTDCQTGRGEPTVPGRSPGNIVATRPFQVVGMDHVPSLPRSHRGNSELLIWVDQHSGYVIVSPNRSRQAQEVAEAYERCVYRRFGASEVIRHDREAAFMSEVFKAFNRLIGQRTKATLAYRPQANGMTERMVQTIMRAVKLYVQDSEQKDWDDYAERLVFAINTAHDRVRGDTPHYHVHGWDARTTLETVVPSEPCEAGNPSARRWRASIQGQYIRARQEVCRKLQEAMESRRSEQHEAASGDPADFEPGAQVWVFVNQVKPGYAKKLAQLWHGPFRVLERVGEHLVRLEVQGTGYQFFPVVHVARLKLRQESWSRPQVDLEVDEGDRFDFDEALLPDDSWEPDAAEGEFEVEAILRYRERRSARQGHLLREYEVRWVGYDEPTWVAEDDLNCAGLLADYHDRLKARGRYEAMQADDESH